MLFHTTHPLYITLEPSISYHTQPLYVALNYSGLNHAFHIQQDYDMSRTQLMHIIMHNTHHIYIKQSDKYQMKIEKHIVPDSSTLHAFFK